MDISQVFKKFFDISVDGLFITDRKYRFVEVNPSYCHLTGWSRDELLDKCFTDIETGIDFHNHLENAATSGRDILKTSLMRKDKTSLFVEICTTLFESVKERYFLSHVRDITDLQAKDEGLEKIQEYARYLIDSSFDMIIGVDKNRKIVEFNNAAQKAFGYTKEEVIGENITMLYTNPEAAEIPAHILHDKGHFSSEVLNKRKNGELFHSFVTATLIKDSHCNVIGTMGVSRDITDRIQREKELKEAKKQAEAASRAKDDFFANMTHEIRTPLNAIIGHAELGVEINSPVEMKQYLASIKESADFLLILLNSVLLYSKIEANKLELEEREFDFRVAVESTAQIMSAQAHKKNVELLCRISPEVPGYLIGDSTRLKEILVNTIGNAIKFTEEGEIVIDVCLDQSDEDNLGKNEDEIILFFSIKDTGIGIPEEKIKSIFNSFEQVDSSTTRKYGGTGLGLSISNKLVQLMNGKMSVESEVGKGSAFRFTVSLKKVSKRRSRTKEWDLQGKRALIIDKNEMSRYILREMFEKWGFDVNEAETSKSGLSKLRNDLKKKNPYDLTICDSRMPDDPDFNIAKTISEAPSLSKHTIIMLNTNHRKGDTSRIRELGLTGYILKPVKQIELQKLIAKSFGLKFSGSSGEIEKDEIAGTPKPGSMESAMPQKAPLPAEWKEPLKDEEVLSSPGTKDKTLIRDRKAFVANMPEKFDKLKPAMRNNDFTGIEKTAEVIKKSAADVGAILMKNEAFRIVLASRNEDAERCDFSFKRLKKGYRMTSKIINRRVKRLVRKND